MRTGLITGSDEGEMTYRVFFSLSSLGSPSSSKALIALAIPRMTFSGRVPKFHLDWVVEVDGN